MNKKLYLFQDLGTDRQFYYGDKPHRIFLKLTPIHAILLVDHNEPPKDDKWHVVNPHVLIFPDTE